MQRLRDAHARTLAGWKGLLTAHPAEAALAEAFVRYMDEFPDARKRVCGSKADSTMLSLALAKLFPTLAARAPEALSRIAADLLGLVIANAQVSVCVKRGRREVIYWA